MVICLQQGADLHLAQLMPLPLTVSCFSKIQIGSTFLVPAHLGSPGKRAVKQMCVCVSSSYLVPLFLEAKQEQKWMYLLAKILLKKSDALPLHHYPT